MARFLAFKFPIKYTALTLKGEGGYETVEYESTESSGTEFINAQF
jgi:hypothetical protein